MAARHFLLSFLTATSTQALHPGFKPNHENPADFHPHPILGRQNPTVEPCAQVAASWQQQRAFPDVMVSADVAVACLRSVPVDATGDLQEIEELKQFLQYHSTLAYLKAGVRGQIEALDLLTRLDQIADGIKTGRYKNDYDVQLSIRALLDSAGDFHLHYHPDLTSFFDFRRAGNLVSVSSDGLALPEIFDAADLYRQAAGNFTPSPIISINGKDASKYVEDISLGYNYHDADARFNRALLNPVDEAVIGTGLTNGNFAQYYTLDATNTTVRFANGTIYELQNIARFSSVYNLATVKDGLSFFSAFGRGWQRWPRLQVPVVPAPIVSLDTPILVGYPKPDFIIRSKTFSGYSFGGKYNDTSVLVLATFDPKSSAANVSAADGLLEAQSALRRFLADCIRQRKEKLIIDLRGNGGGTIDLGFEVFRQLFPTIEPFGGARYRVHDAFRDYSAALAALAVNGTNIDDIVNDNNIEDGDFALQNVFLWSNILDVNGRPYKSFGDYYGPQILQNDTFAGIRRYNFSKTPGGHTSVFNLTGYLDQPIPSRPFKPENIVILSDGSCGSTCAIFAELMREQARVQTIVVGGRPNNKPMQSVGGSKGSQVLNFDFLKFRAGLSRNISQALSDGPNAQQLRISSATLAIFNASQILLRSAQPGEGLIAGRVNSLNNQRQNDTAETPLEFIYEAADCRLFYTAKSFVNPTALWQQAFEAKWGNGSCVSGSTGDASAIGVINGTAFENKGRSSKNGTVTAPVSVAGRTDSRLSFVVSATCISFFLTAFAL